MDEIHSRIAEPRMIGPVPTDRCVREWIDAERILPVDDQSPGRQMQPEI